MSVDQSSPGSRRWCIALHDVSPRTWRECARWTDLCAALGLSPPALFVIPDHHVYGESDGAGLPPEFVDWLCARHAAGSTLWMHGFTHRGASEAPSDEAEFDGLDAEAASVRIRAGLAAWSAAGIPHPSGFCPPTWRIARAGLAAARAQGFDAIDLRLGRLVAGRFRYSPALSSWGGGSLAARAWDRTLPAQAGLLAAMPLPVRIALHPQDFATDAGEAFARILAKLAGAPAKRSTPRPSATREAAAR